MFPVEIPKANELQFMAPTHNNARCWVCLLWVNTLQMSLPFFILQMQLTIIGMKPVPVLITEHYNISFVPTGDVNNGAMARDTYACSPLARKRFLRICVDTPKITLVLIYVRDSVWSTTLALVICLSLSICTMWPCRTLSTNVLYCCQHQNTMFLMHSSYPR